MNENAAQYSDNGSGDCIGRPVDARENSRDGDEKRKNKIPNTPAAVVKKDNRRQREKESGMAGRNGTAAFRNKRLETQGLKRPRGIIEKPDYFRYKSSA